MDAALDELKGDPSHQFLAVYRRTMGAVNDAIAARGFSDPDWMIACNEIFAELYLDTLDAWLTGAPVPPPWRVAFPLNRWASTRFIAEARAKVSRNTAVLDRARRQSPEALTATMAELGQISAARIADLLRPGQVLLRLARDGFGVLLADA